MDDVEITGAEQVCVVAFDTKRGAGREPIPRMGHHRLLVPPGVEPEEPQWLTRKNPPKSPKIGGFSCYAVADCLKQQLG